MGNKKEWQQPMISFVDLMDTEDPGKTVTSVLEGFIYHT